MDKIIRKHGMTSEKAKRVKERGHKKEFIYATLIRGEVIGFNGILLIHHNRSRFALPCLL